jgi:hypothetical protein
MADTPSPKFRWVLVPTLHNLPARFEMAALSAYDDDNLLSTHWSGDAVDFAEDDLGGGESVVLHDAPGLCWVVSFRTAMPVDRVVAMYTQYCAGRYVTAAIVPVTEWAGAKSAAEAAVAAAAAALDAADRAYREAMDSDSDSDSDSDACGR